MAIEIKDVFDITIASISTAVIIGTILKDIQQKEFKRIIKEETDKIIEKLNLTTNINKQKIEDIENRVIRISDWIKDMIFKEKRK